MRPVFLFCLLGQWLLGCAPISQVQERFGAAAQRHPDPGTSSSREDDDREIKKAIVDLGSDQYRDRQRASDRQEAWHPRFLGSLQRLAKNKGAGKDNIKSLILDALDKPSSRPLLLAHSLKVFEAIGEYDQLVRLVEERIRRNASLSTDAIHTALFLCENKLLSCERAVVLYDKLVALEPKRAELRYGSARVLIPETGQTQRSDC